MNYSVSGKQNGMCSKTELNGWVESLILDSKLAISDTWEIVSLQGDASCRQYFRLVCSQSRWILVSSPLDRIDNQVFINIATHWREQGVNVPQVLQAENSKGFMLLEDFGERHLFDGCKESIELSYYSSAIDQLHKIQKIPATELPVFDETFLLRELELFNTWFVKGFLKRETPGFLAQVNTLLVKSSLEQPQVTMHRDFHCRNLLLCDNQVGVIDFQDAVIGPLAYDLVSLLKDCYITLSDEQMAILLDEYLENLNTSNLLASHVDKHRFKIWFDLIGLQRHLKVLGLFLRLAIEEGKTTYLSDLPRVFQYVLAVTAQYPDLHVFHDWLREQALPVLEREPWGRA